MNCLADPDVRASIESLYRQYQRHYVGRSSEPAIPSTAKFPHVHKITHRLDADTIERLVADYTDGMKAADVASHYGISKDATLRLLHQRGVVRPRSAQDRGSDH